MIINKAALVKALEVVKPGLANKDMIEQSTSFAFMDDRIVTYNDEISISYPIKDLHIKGAVKAEELYQLLNKLKKDEIDIEIDETEIVLTCGRVTAGLTLQKTIKLPLEEIGDFGEWKDLPSDFFDGCGFVVNSCSNDMSRPVITCVHVNGTITEATDSYCLSQYTLSSKVPIHPFLLPSSSVRELIKIKPTQIAAGSGWVHFKTKDGAIISCRILQDTYMDTSSFIKVHGLELTLPKTMNEILERAAVFAKQEQAMDECVTVELENNRIRIESKSSTGRFKEEANMKYSGEKVIFNITPAFLKDILAKSNTCVVNSDKISFTGTNWIFLAMLRAI